MRCFAIPTTSTIRPGAMKAWDHLADHMGHAGIPQLLVHANAFQPWKIWTVGEHGGLRIHDAHARVSSALRALNAGLDRTIEEGGHRCSRDNSILAVDTRWIAFLSANHVDWFPPYGWMPQTTLPKHNIALLVGREHGDNAHTTLALWAACRSHLMRRAIHTISPHSPFTVTPHLA